MTLRVCLVLTAAAVSIGVIAPAFAQAPTDPLPDDPAKMVIMSACTSCHDLGLITIKPRTADEWDRLIGKMVDRGAALTDAEQKQVLAYLVKNLGVKPEVGSADRETRP
jgi:cytochrome c5